MRRFRLGQAGEQVEGPLAFGAAVDGVAGAHLADAVGRCLGAAVAGPVQLFALDLGEGDELDELVDRELPGKLGGQAFETKGEPEQRQPVGIALQPFFASATVGGGLIRTSEMRCTMWEARPISTASSARVNSGLPFSSSARLIRV